ncbi:Uncharacterised protein [Achromobacter spanius]|uniref:phage tail protein n=1 Tax=Achromobacter spanius TaxID=217203 RepID=UPI000C2C781D|nr:phage tail protein [Achromobacter spanius]AUA58937.1 phage tail protein [Achromobacter spanius]CAB3663490.1 hypothetical protein LMG5911_03095 [Achromobacter spanius]SPT40343.1 Uncharacterised protein [Achromobacter denitrificans]VEE58898.1 Uncharacterised protein [Achromobacter spanius]
MQKDVFQTGDHGLYLYKSIANELAFTPGAFNIPYGAFEDAPPAPPAGKWPQRVGEAWIMVDDYRTTPLWVVETGASYSLGAEHDGAGGKVSYPGRGRLPAWLTGTEPPRPAEVASVET